MNIQLNKMKVFLWDEPWVQIFVGIKIVNWILEIIYYNYNFVKWIWKYEALCMIQITNKKYESVCMVCFTVTHEWINAYKHVYMQSDLGNPATCIGTGTYPDLKHRDSFGKEKK